PGEQRTYRGREPGGRQEGWFGRGEGYGYGRGEDFGREAGRGGREWGREYEGGRGFGYGERGRGEYDEYGGMGGGREYGGFMGGAYGGGGAYPGGTAYGRYGSGEYMRDEGFRGRERGGEWREGRGHEEGGGMMERLKEGVRKLTGRGPKGYRRSDDRIRDEVSERIARSWIDADDVEVQVQSGEVTLTGTVARREDKRQLEDLAEDVFGVDEVHNHLRVRRGTEERAGQTGLTAGQTGTSAAQGGMTAGQTGTTAGQTGQRTTQPGTTGQRGTQSH
ncbi:MAG TPA: BON domain-containing protein, partial [Anaeromyxobacteraceae bacterium]|nr:BON domain-containing protein [Anaeromyxobacteraceae bacterium]